MCPKVQRLVPPTFVSCLPLQSHWGHPWPFHVGLGNLTHFHLLPRNQTKWLLLLPQVAGVEGAVHLFSDIYWARELLDVCRSRCVALTLTFRATLCMVKFQTQRKAPLGQLLLGLTGPMNQLENKLERSGSWFAVCLYSGLFRMIWIFPVLSLTHVSHLCPLLNTAWMIDLIGLSNMHWNAGKLCNRDKDQVKLLHREKNNSLSK